MSWHLPYRGLSREILDMIYQYALVAPQGVVIYEAPDSGAIEHNQIVASNLIRLTNLDSKIALRIIYSQNAFIVKLRVDETFDWLESLNPKWRGMIKDLHLTTELRRGMWPYQTTDNPARLHSRRRCKVTAYQEDLRAATNTKDLSTFLITHMAHLNSLTLPLTSPSYVHILPSEWPNLWAMVLQAFKNGCFGEIRYCFSQPLKHPHHPLSPFVPLEFQGRHEWAGVLCSVFFEDLGGNPDPNPDPQLNSFDWERAAPYLASGEYWAKAGYTVNLDESRPGDEGTAFVIRRI